MKVIFWKDAFWTRIKSESGWRRLYVNEEDVFNWMKENNYPVLKDQYNNDKIYYQWDDIIVLHFKLTFL